MQTIFNVIADPTRRHILDLLRQRPHSVGELVDELQISQPGVSKQLRLLRESGLVHVQQQAQLRWYHLDPEPLQEVDTWLEAYRESWSERYGRLDAYLQKLQTQEKENNDE
ncbi:MAG: ArsR/SmtB family transcription factor [Candidatus Promineifilaceae bacterium]|jgi:DNA-binding transcriptional ArsR family regulator